MAWLKSKFSILADKRFLKLVLLVITSAVSLGILIFPYALRPSSFPLSIGSVAQQDIQAPQALTFESQVLTEEAKDAAEAMVPPVYLSADPAITRRQIENLRLTLNYITSIRADAYATPEQKKSDLALMEYVQLTDDMMIQLLTLSDSRWEALQVEALSVLEQVMRSSIRDNQIRDARRNIPTLISFSLPPEQTIIVTEIVSQLVVPNSLYSEEQTTLARQQARDATQPVYRSFVTGETIVLRGQVITSVTYEALEQFNLIQPRRNTEQITAAASIVLPTALFMGLYFHKRTNINKRVSIRGLALVCLVFILFLFSARLIIPNRTVVPYLFPIPAFGLTIASLFGMELGLVFSLVLSILTAYNLPNGLDLVLFYTLSSFCGVLMLGRARRVASFFWAGILVGLTGAAVILAYRLPDSSTDLVGLATLIGSSFFNGMAAASVSLLLQYLFSQVLGLTTALQLMEISRPDHPALQIMMRYAPGTYQHSLQVANIAEQAAEAIGADALLVRVGALYHDVGKAAEALYFIENQLPGTSNPHEELSPEESARRIIQHVEDGVRLARKYRLPPRIQDFIREHHGTFITRYQYARAVEAAGGNPDLVNSNVFRYPGPTPLSRETALLMLADGCEARARAELPKTEEDLTTLVKQVIEFCRKEGQLDDTALTLRDLAQITDSIVNTLRNTHHPRLKYPEIKTNAASSTSQDPQATLPNPTTSVVPGNEP